MIPAAPLRPTPIICALFCTPREALDAATFMPVRRFDRSIPALAWSNDRALPASVRCCDQSADECENEIELAFDAMYARYPLLTMGNWGRLKIPVVKSKNSPGSFPCMIETKSVGMELLRLALYPTGNTTTLGLGGVACVAIATVMSSPGMHSGFNTTGVPE